MDLIIFKEEKTIVETGTETNHLKVRLARPKKKTIKENLFFIDISGKETS